MDQRTYGRRCGRLPGCRARGARARGPSPRLERARVHQGAHSWTLRGRRRRWWCPAYSVSVPVRAGDWSGRGRDPHADQRQAAAHAAGPGRAARDEPGRTLCALRRQGQRSWHLQGPAVMTVTPAVCTVGGRGRRGMFRVVPLLLLLLLRLRLSTCECAVQYILLLPCCAPEAGCAWPSSAAPRRG